MDLPTAESISADTVRHLQPAGYTTHTTVWGRRGEKRRTNLSPIHSDALSLSLSMSSFQHAVCAKLPCGGQWSIWRRSEAWSWSRSAPGSRRSRTGCVSADCPVQGLVLLTNHQIFAAEVICRSRVWRIMLEASLDGNYWSNLLIHVFSSPSLRIGFGRKKTEQFIARCMSWVGFFLEWCSATSDFKSNQARMTHS